MSTQTRLYWRMEQRRTKAELCEGKAACCGQAVDLPHQQVMMLLGPQLQHRSCPQEETGWRTPAGVCENETLLKIKLHQQKLKRGQEQMQTEAFCM